MFRIYKIIKTSITFCYSTATWAEIDFLISSKTKLTIKNKILGFINMILHIHFSKLDMHDNTQF